MSSEPFDAAGRDPFGSTTAAQAYVPRPACERVLDELLAAVRRGAPCVALAGPNGIGKTQLVRVLAERLAGEAELLLLPYAAVGFADLCHWVLGLLGEAQGPFSDPGGALLEAAATRAAAGRRLILALDDASGLPIETARKLSALIQQAEGELQLVVIPVDDPRAGRVLAALGSEVALVRFNTPMSAEETLHYVRERLRASEATPALRDRFAEPVIAWLHRESGGLPRELHILAVKFLRDRPEANRDRLARSEEWLEIDTHETDAHELDAHEEEAAPVAEAELLGPEAEQPETPTDPGPATDPTSTPEVEPPAPQAAAPRAASDDPSWLRSHLPLVIGLALVAVGVFFALRGGPPPAPPTAAWPPVAEQPSPARAPAPSPAVPAPDEPAAEVVQLPDEPAAEVVQLPDEPAAEVVQLPDEPTTETQAAIPEQTPVAEAAAPLAAATPTPTLVSDDVMPTEAPAEPLVVAEPEAPAEPAEIVTEVAVEAPPSTPEAAPTASPEAAEEAKLEEVAPSEPEPASPAPSPKRTEPASAPTPSPARRVARPAAPAPAPKLLPVAATGPPVSVRVDADPPARILIDGRDHGSTPLVDLPLASGRHRFEIVFPDDTRLLREKLIDANHREFRFSRPPTDQ